MAEVTRSSRIKDYSNPNSPKNWNGASRDMGYIDRWSGRASDNSEIAPRAKGKTSNNGSTEKDRDPPRVHSTGKAMRLRDTEARPYRERSGDAMREAAKADKNHSDSSPYLKGVR